MQTEEQLSDISYQIARVKGHLGGFGLGFLEDQILTSFVASITACLPEIITAHPTVRMMIEGKIAGVNDEELLSDTILQYFSCIDTLAARGVKIGEQSISVLALTTLNKGCFKGLQQELTKHLHVQRQQDLLDMLGNDHRAVATFVSGQTQ